MSGIDHVVEVVRQSQKTLFILCGYPYSGKSFVAQQLRVETGIEYVSIDAIFQAHGFDWSSNLLPDTEAWQQIFNESYEAVKEALSEGKNISYDSTNQTVASRDTLREVATSMNAASCVIYVQSPVQIIWQRWEENNQNPSRSIVSKELVQQTIDMFEIPTAAENVLVIDN